MNAKCKPNVPTVKVPKRPLTAHELLVLFMCCGG